MKSKIIILSLTTASLWGCASQPMASTSDVKEARPYTDGVVGVSAKSADAAAKSDCSRGLLQKGLTWKRQLGVANACARAGQAANLETISNRLAQTDHLAPWGPYYLSVAAEMRKDYGRAMWMIELALKKAPKSGILTYQQARIQWLLRDQAGAIKSFNRALDLDPNLADAHVLLGQLAMADGKMDEAGVRFQKALAVDPRHTGALLALAEVHIKKNESKAALDLLSQVVFLSPANTRARVRQAHVYEALEKNLSEALTAYRRIKNLDRDHKLDAPVEIDLDAKIQALEVAVKGAAPNSVTLRDPAIEKKVAK